MQFLYTHTQVCTHKHTHTHTHSLAKCFTQGLSQAEMFIFLQLCFSRVCLKSQLWAGHRTTPGRQIENILLRTWSYATRAEKGLIRYFWLGGEINYFGVWWGIDSYSCCFVVVVAVSVCPPCTLQCPAVRAFSFTFRVCRTSFFCFLHTFFLIRGICWMQQEQHSCSQFSRSIQTYLNAILLNCFDLCNEILGVKYFVNPPPPQVQVRLWFV